MASKSHSNAIDIEAAKFKELEEWLDTGGDEDGAIWKLALKKFLASGNSIGVRCLGANHLAQVLPPSLQHFVLGDDLKSTFVDDFAAIRGKSPAQALRACFQQPPSTGSQAPGSVAQKDDASLQAANLGAARDEPHWQNRRHPVVESPIPIPGPSKGKGKSSKGNEGQSKGSSAKRTRSDVESLDEDSESSPSTSRMGSSSAKSPATSKKRKT